MKSFAAFGFCEFAGPDPALRAIRLLHEMDIGGKKLVVKVDAKTKTDLDEFKGNCSVVASLELKRLWCSESVDLIRCIIGSREALQEGHVIASPGRGDGGGRLHER